MAKPEKKFQAGAISAAVWKNSVNHDGKDIDVFNVTIERRYLDKDKTWKSTNSFKVNDLPKVELIARKAFEFLALKEESEIKA